MYQFIVQIFLKYALCFGAKCAEFVKVCARVCGICIVDTCICCLRSLMQYRLHVHF